MSAPTVVSAAATTYASANSILVALPPSLVVGNFVLIFISTRQYNNTFTISDADPTWRFLYGASSDQGIIYYKIINGSEPTNVTVTFSTQPSVASAFAVQVSGTSEVPIEGQARGPTTSTSITQPTFITLKRDTDLMISVWHNAGSTGAITIPGSQTSILGNTTGNAQCINGAYEVLSSNAATGTRVATIPVSQPNMVFGAVVRESNTSGILLKAPYSNTDYANAGVYGGNGHGSNGAVDIGGAMGHFWGRYKVSGHTRQAGTLDPLYRRVMLMDKYGQKVIRGQMSVNADGSYTFTNLPAGEYIVLGVDQNNIQNAVVCARITAVAM